MNPSNKLPDEALDGINGGVQQRYPDSYLKRAGVTVSKASRGQTVYSTMINGKSVEISQTVANGIADCYGCAGNKQMTDQEKLDLIAQS